MKKRLSLLLIKVLTLSFLITALVPLNKQEVNAYDMPVYIKEGVFSNGDVYRRYDVATVRNYNLADLKFDMDFTNIDKFYYDCYFNNVKYCSCGRPNTGYRQYQELTLQGKQTYTFDLMNYNSDELHKSDDYYVAYKGYGVEHAIFNAYVPQDKCMTCNESINRCTTTGYFYLVDCRGSARMSSTYNVSAGGSVTVYPDYNEYSARVSWGIKYSENETFTPLSDGKLSNGIVVCGSQTKQLVLSNMPKKNMQFYVGAYIYDKDGQLPVNATYPDTKFYSKISVYYDGKDEEETEMPNTGGDNNNNNPGTSSGDNNTGNTGNPGTLPSDNNTTVTTPNTGSPNTGNTTPSNPGNQNTGTPNTNNNNPSTDNNSNPSSGNNAGMTTPSAADNKPANQPEDKPVNTLSDYKDSSKKEYITGTVIKTPSEKNPVKVSSQKETGENTGGTENTKTGSPKLLSESDKNKLFDEIRKNSHEYITNSETSKRNLKENAADLNSDKLKLSSLENPGDEELYENPEGYDEDEYLPDVKHKSKMFYAVIITLVILFLLLLLFVLFFGVIIVADKENELLKFNDDFNIKVPVGIRIVTIFNGEWAINFGELLSEYDVLDVYLGILFAYVYEGEAIKILTKFKGGDKKEIATEKIFRQFSVGSKRGGHR